MTRMQIITVLAFTLTPIHFARAQSALSSVFTYQGRLNASGSAANGTFDLRFTLWRHPTSLLLVDQISSAVCMDNIAVADGLFTVALDFGFSAFNGDARWLAVEVRADTTPANCGSGAYTLLSPRQALTAAPHALRARDLIVPAQLTSSNLGFPTLTVNYQGAGADFAVRATTTSSANGTAAISALADADSGSNYAVFAKNDSVNGRALFGYAFASSGENYGVYGLSSSVDGYGVYGRALSPTGTTYGVFGAADSPQGFAGFFSGRTYIDGNLGLGVSNPTFRLQLANNSAAKPTSNTWTISSDRRLKKNIATIQHALDRALSLRGVTYQWIDPASQGGMTGTYTGMIAQEVEPVFPEWIGEDANGHKTLTVIGFEGVVVEALRELRREKDREIRQLRDEIAELRTRMERLEGIVESAAAGSPR